MKSLHHGTFVAALLFAVGCATAPQPVTKIVNGRVVVTRAVSPEAYEHVTRAYLYEQEERWKDAADELQRALPFDSEAAEERAHLAELFIKLERLDDAAEQIARSLQIGETVEGYLARAHLAQAHDDEAHHAQAIPALRDAARLALEDDDPEAIELTHLELSEAQVVTLDLGAALETARRLVDAVPETLRGRLQLAVVGWATGAFDQAAAALASAIEIEPNDVEARILLAELQVATNKIPAGKASFRAAIDRADAAMAVADAFAGWLVLRGDVAEAQELADRLVADAGDADTLATASTFERTVKRFDRAVALAERAAKLGLAAGRRALLIGAAALVKEDKPGAVAAYLGVDKKDPSFFEARLRAAEVLREQGKVDEAERALNEAADAVSQADTPAQVEDRRIELAVALSQVDEKRGDAARAARRLDDALGKDPDAHGDPRLILARAAVDERRGDWQRAIARGERVLARKPRSVEALNFVGFVAADHGHDMARTLKRIQAAVVLSPGSGAIIDSLGWAYFRTGDLARADIFLEQAGRLEPGDAEVMEHLGDLYAKRQERDRALATYRRALDFKPSDRVARELGDRIRTLEAKSAAGR
ncbi:MAG TPA: tetratricopeptide repeat protein [Polyangia bacterium]|nr:tetratricopeptide repeat protein [Polyangia bacterium]